MSATCSLGVIRVGLRSSTEYYALAASSSHQFLYRYVSLSCVVLSLQTERIVVVLYALTQAVWRVLYAIITVFSRNGACYCMLF